MGYECLNHCGRKLTENKLLHAVQTQTHNQYDKKVMKYPLFVEECNDLLLFTCFDYYLLVGIKLTLERSSLPRSPKRPVSPTSNCSYVCPIANAAESCISPGNNCCMMA